MARWFVDRLPQAGIPSVSLRRLLPEARIAGGRDWEVSGCSADSRRLDPGQWFVAVRGSRHDGHAFVRQALDRGAAGVIVEHPCPEAGHPQVVVPDSRTALARICQALAGDPAEQLLLFGVTGTCGKTVTSLFLRSIFEASGLRFGLVGSLGWSDGVVAHPVGAAVPGAEALAGMLSEMVEHGCAGGVLEVARETLERRRLEGLPFNAAVVTDLGGPRGFDPNDLLARRRAKARLFQRIVPGGAAVVNADDPHAELLGAVNLDARRVTFALHGPADVTARVERLDGQGSRFRLLGFDREASVDLRLIGPGNVSRALAAAAVAWAHEVPIAAVVEGLESVAAVPGRLEAVHEGQPFEVRIDPTRTGADLQDALTALRAVCPGKVHCVVGAEGNQDRRARLALAEAAESGADRVILTTNNPRAEDPNQVLDDLLAGCRRPGRVRVEIDRRRAIETTLADARPGDGVLIAGKGRNTFQIFADHAAPFDDKAVATNWLRGHRPSLGRSSA